MKNQLIFSSGFFTVVLLIITGISLTSSNNDRRFFKERNITTEEYQFALSIFEREFPPKDMITIANGTGIGNRPYVRPSINGGIQMNLGDIYNNPLATQTSRELFAHELTHAWQLEHYGYLWYSKQAIGNQVIDGAPYDYKCDAVKTLGDYNAEQMGEIVKDYYKKDPCATAVSRPLRSTTWKLLTGSDAVDIAVGNDGVFYMVNTAATVYVYNASLGDWSRLPVILGKTIAANAGKVYLINALGKFHQLNGAAWTQLPGSDGKDIAVDTDGTLWMVNRVGKIYKLNGSSWKQMPGSDASRISAGGGQVWMVNTVGKIYKYNGSGWTQTAGSAGSDIAVSNEGKVFLTNTAGKIYQMTGNTWTQLDGTDGKVVAVNNSKLVLINKKGRMYFRSY